MPDVPGFRPSTHAFLFGNDFPPQPDKKIPTPFGDIAIGDASNGLCGGMVFAVRDYFEAGIRAPSGRQPTNGQPLFDFIVDRLFASFDLPHGPTKYYDWMTSPDHDTWFRQGLPRRTIEDEWPRIKADIDNGRLSCLGLVTTASLNPGDMGKNHQVLAYGYDIGADNSLSLKVYDPNSRDSDAVRVTLPLGNPGRTTPISHNVNVSSPVRGFFWVPFSAVPPPTFDDGEIEDFLAPHTMPAAGGALVTLTVRNTGTDRWPSGGQNAVRLGSQMPQDNKTWGVQRVDLPRDIPPREAADFSFTVTGPASAGLHVMGWRMVKESRYWFGELEQRNVLVAGPVADACQQLREEIEHAEYELRTLQAELADRTGRGKVFLAAQIRKQLHLLEQLKAAAEDRGCPNIS